MRNWGRVLFAITGAILILAATTYGLGCSPNPVTNYAIEKRLSSVAVKEFMPFDKDGVMDESEKALIDEYASLPQDLQVSDKVLNYLKNFATDKKITNDELDSFRDFDKDNLKNSEELKYGTDLFDEDSDKDGLKDGEEVLVYKTSPLNEDSDNDGLKDSDEILTYRTDPLSNDSDSDGLTDSEEIIVYGTDPLKPNPNVVYGLKKNPSFYGRYIDKLTILDTDGRMGENERYFLDKIPEYPFLITFLDILVKDGNVDNNERSFVDLTINYSKVNEVLPWFYNEIAKLPDLSSIEKEDIEAIEDILALATNPKYKVAFEAMGREGIPESRKLCAPLEALLWIAYDREFDKPCDNPLAYLAYFSVGKLIDEAWTDTTTSKNYTSKRWLKFEEVVDRLNSPNLVIMYMQRNILYDDEEARNVIKGGTPRWATPRETFETKKGICTEQSAFALNCLLSNGYKYDNFDINKRRAACILFARPSPIHVGHATCLYVDEDNSFYIINNGKRQGPFSTIEEAANATWENWGVYGFRNVDYVITQTITRK